VSNDCGVIVAENARASLEASSPKDVAAFRVSANGAIQL
jgi:hypothetical protein